ncbi:transcription-repair coupling factor [Lapidilactobacillus mulanensis]|uniref:Transcription-repair-coupling factor n=1 Tax=Lapidilactobacillus mulanensis TaxID=2485999 RepID=A0ABW4DPV9_9LACO|nr:transcription-repair coupling factor [Lapidilactobacillus mulanensis]
MDLIDFYSQAVDLPAILKDWEAPQRRLVTGLNGSAESLYLAGLVRHSSQPILFVVDSGFHASKFVDDLNHLLPADQVFYFPVEEVVAAQGATSSPESRNLRIQALNFLQSQQPGIVVTSAAGFSYELTDADKFQQSVIDVHSDGQLDLARLPDRLVEMGYERQKLVAKPGEFAIRGDIADIFPLDFEDPIRIELFDDEIDSIRRFDLATQRSIENLTALKILPARDRLISIDDRKSAAVKIQKSLTKELKRIHDKEKQDEVAKSKNSRKQEETRVTSLKEYFQNAISELGEGILGDQASLLIDFLTEKPSSLTDYLSDQGLVVFDDFGRLLDKVDDMAQELAGWQTDQLELGHLLPEQKIRLDFRQVHRDISQRQLHIALFQRGLGNLRFDQLINVTMRTVQQFFSQMPLIKTEMDRWHKQNRTVLVLIPEEGRRKHLQQTFRDFEVNVALAADDDIQVDQLQLIAGNLHNGFEIPEAKLVVLTEWELFNRVKKQTPARRQTMANTERLRSYNELKPGDYVVHVNHGIGRYEGMQTIEVDGVHRDYLTITYQDSAQLFIPVDQLNMVSKYVSAEGKSPHINRLGGSEWQKTKKKVASRIEDIADDLIDLYAKRQAEKGHAFGPDDDLQKQFENEFPYTETPDQLRSTEEVKHDMEQPRPMDRLLVGDVGFGKTEVALRAAFKAIEENKQVAFLVPTTILAQQHLETMQDRFSDFPINIAIMSRFQTSAENKKTINGLKKGTIDIVVGTHRLLSKDVGFQDLGLLIIDEEQRFGVKHKERMKQLRSQVDVLTLTATPIPRTLHMSMIGVRDLSVIETPPTNRYPIQTYVMEQNAGAIKSSIEREIERHGQVFYLHNRVEDIERTVDQIQALVPEATVGFAHGQMTENQLENVIYNFVNGEFDVLVTTTIIETGVDMPNANTLIVENADRYGLSQLYQLRGRVGRSSRIAYAYLMYSPAKVLTEVSEKRLQAIKDFTELGSGFKIAMRDLSIRGAGNLLGKQQHGFINSVGFDLYSQMLNDAVKKKQHEKVVPVSNAELKLAIDAYLPSNYVDDSRQKIEIYKRVRQIENVPQLEEIQADLIDRFGDYPHEVENLLSVGQLKLLADQIQLEQIKQEPGSIQIIFSKAGTKLLDGEALFSALSTIDYHADVKIEQERYQIKFQIPKKEVSDQDWLKKLMTFLQAVEKIES